jgi:hypothetical protein
MWTNIIHWCTGVAVFGDT